MMSSLCVLLCVVTASSALPRNGYRLLPQRSVMFGGYYGHPGHTLPRRPYFPQGSMTAIISGDTIATNSFAGEQFSPESQFEEEEAVESYTERRKAVVEDSQLDLEEDNLSELSTTTKPKRIPKRKQPKPQKDEDEEEDEDSSSKWPFSSGQGGAPSYNAFFPIMLGGQSGSKTRSSSDEGYYPGAATAIANSFSTGKGGVASSHATAFGDPYSAMLFRNGMNFRKTKSQKQK